MNWIKVTDKLPEEEGEYLCLVKSTRNKIERKIRNFWINPLTKERIFYYKGHKIVRPTHWMYLPDLPGENI